MASYQARQRDPLLDRQTQAMIERRGRELLGLVLVAAALAVAMMLASYSPDDPSFLSSTEDGARNLFGRLGASVASPLIVIAGLASWGLTVVLAVWGTRLIFHVGQERLFGRILFAPIAIALAAIYASTHVPGPGWVHSFSLGGLFGDTVLGAILGVLPIKATLGLKILALIMMCATIALSAFVLGFTRPELVRIGQFLLWGIVITYSMILRLAGLCSMGLLRMARHLNARRITRAEARAESRDSARAAARVETGAHALAAAAHGHAAQVHSEPPLRRAVQVHEAPRPVLRAERSATAPVPAGLPAAPAGPAEAGRPGLLSRLGALRGARADKAMAEAPREAETLYSADDLGDPEIRARIADIIRNRIAQNQGVQPVTLRAEPPIHAGAVPAGASPAGAQSPAMPAATVQARSGAPFVQPASEMSRAELGLDDAIFGDDDDDFDLDPANAYAAPQTGWVDPKKVVQPAMRKPAAPSRKAQAEAQPRLNFGDAAPDYETPPLGLLTSPSEVERHQLSNEALEENARMLESVLDDYGVKGEIVSVRPGPVVTMYELEPAPGLKASRVIGLSDDIARSMSALSARVSTVPGRSVIGIELPNAHREKVVLREILAARDFGDSNMRLPLALGKDIGGSPVVANLAKMPHLLIAGTTGSGKSVAINTMILSLLYKLTPEDCRLIMIDPKMLELSVYDGIPHLLSPVVTDPKKAVVALKWVVGEMEERYRKMSKMGVRNIEGYNGRVRDAQANDELFSRTVQTGFDDVTGEPVFETEEFLPERLPYIVVIVDEMADLMMVAGKEIEACIQRLAQMARASGIHLIMATQRPSVDVITGTIKANFPTRISFQVTSKIDSRTILGEQGAEQLLGMGDMLFMAGGSRITRVHGPFVSDEEVEDVVNALKAYGPPSYIGGVIEGPDEDRENDIDMVLGLGGGDGDDALYDQAVAIVVRDRKCSTSYIQRKLAIGYNKAARLVEQMEDNGVVTPANHVGKREILVPEQ